MDCEMIPEETKENFVDPEPSEDSSMYSAFPGKIPPIEERICLAIVNACKRTYGLDDGTATMITEFHWTGSGVVSTQSCYNDEYWVYIVDPKRPYNAQNWDPIDGNNIFFDRYSWGVEIRIDPYNGINKVYTVSNRATFEYDGCGYDNDWGPVGISYRIKGLRDVSDQSPAFLDFTMNRRKDSRFELRDLLCDHNITRIDTGDASRSESSSGW